MVTLWSGPGSDVTRVNNGDIEQTNLNESVKAINLDQKFKEKNFFQLPSMQYAPPVWARTP